MKPSPCLSYIVCAAFMSQGCSSCNDPVLNGIEPQRPLSGQIVMIHGKRVGGTTVLINGRPIGTTVGAFSPYVQIPYEISGRSNSLQLKDNEGRESRTLEITVDRPGANPFPVPRIEDIGVHRFTLRGDGTCDIWLSVFSANGDINAEILVDDVRVNSIFYNAIASRYFNVSQPSTPFDSHQDQSFGYPIFHYTQHLAYLEAHALDREIRVSIRNQNAGRDDRTYALPQDASSFDSDNDGLLDVWEEGSYALRGGDNTIDLRRLGCSPRRKDILVEVDWARDARPNNSLWTAVENAFARAPILNPDGSRGIRVYIDRGQTRDDGGGQTLIPDHSILGFAEDVAGTNDGYVNFYTYKSRYFAPEREGIFHYCIFGKTSAGGSSGQAEIWGNDFMITNADRWESLLALAGTFIHELGHNIGLRHGGIDNGAPDQDVEDKPNQPSTMNYSYQLIGVSVDCDYTSERIHTFSRGMLNPVPLPETDMINDLLGICDHRELSLPRDGVISLSRENPWGIILYDYNEWAHLKLDFRKAPVSRSYDPAREGSEP